MAKSTQSAKGTPSRDDIQTILYANAAEALKQFTDPNRNDITSMNTYTRDQIRAYLQSPASNQANLRSVANYLYIRSQILYRLVRWYAGMWDLRCRNIKPTYDLEKGLDKNALKNYNNTAKQLDLYNLQDALFEVRAHCYLEDVCYFVWFRDENGAYPYILDPSECKIIGRYGLDFAYAVDMSKWKSAARQNVIEWLGSPFKDMYDEYIKTGNKWIQMPDEYAGCFKYNVEKINLIIPPFAPIFQDLTQLISAADLQTVKDKLDVFKMVVLPMKSLNGAKEADKFEFTPSLNLEYFEQLVQNALPDYVTAAPILGDKVDVIDFSSTSADKQVDRLANAQKNVMNVSGGGAVLNASMISSNAAFTAWLQAETDFAVKPLIGQIDDFTNRMLSFDVSKPCEVRHFAVSEYTKKDFRDKFMSANQYSYNYRLALGTLFGMSELETLASIHFEQDVLGLQNLMIYPLQSSFTTANDGENTGGAPKKDDTELSDSGERSRNK